MDTPLYKRDPQAWQQHLAEGNAHQARKRVGADVVLLDDDSRILIVQPNYKPGWDLPGGMIEANEPPLEGLRRELAEELDLHLVKFQLLCIDWVPPHGPWDDQLAFIFDGGVLSALEQERLTLHDNELLDFRFVEPAELSELLRPRLLRRVQMALEVLHASGNVQYLHDGKPLVE
ncbi:MAG: NUDIX domain-containing protein, partial [Candidatus Dormibacteraceae bacterium]